VNLLQQISFVGAFLLLAMALLSACGGSPRHVPVTQGTAPVRIMPKVTHGQYIVRRGDTLYAIARRYGWNWQVLAAHNSIGSPYTLRVGQIIRFDNRALPAQKRAPVRGQVPSRSPSPARSNRAPVSRPKPAPAKPKATQSRPHLAKKPSTPARATSSVAQKNTTLSSIKWSWPSDGTVIARFAGNNGLNKGIDIAGNLGQPVKAAADGLVTFAGSGLYGNGEALVIKHGSSTVVSVYGHNRRLLVKEGQQVKAGQVIAEMGATGTDRVKLHFEIRHQSKAVDPLLYLPKR